MNELKKVVIFKCFIASPNDTKKEREICDKVFNEINKTIGEQCNFRVESIKWENDARPGFGEDGQAVISEQILNDYQIFIGIMWNKFGTPTKKGGSGTEEEFEDAYKKYTDNKGVEIMFYFNEAPVNANELNLEQLQRVRLFKEKILELGGLYWPYNGTDDFEKNLRNHLNGYFAKKFATDKNKNKFIQQQGFYSEDLILQETVSLILKNRLDQALSLFSNQPKVWVDPVISASNKISQNANENIDVLINLDDLIEKPESVIIKSPPQFGLTCLAHYLVKKAWEKNLVWVYLDAKKARKDNISKSVYSELNRLNLHHREIDCIILDSWLSTENGAKKLLKNLCHEFKKIPIVVMETIDDQIFFIDQENEKINREFNVYHLLALPRNRIRKVISEYNREKVLGDENIVLNKILKDLEVLNIHRTPLNCLTLLRVSENQFDEGPVNRTKMLEMVLFVLFDLRELPTYKIKPDLKDCEFVLGRFCEDLIRNNKYEFTRESFLEELGAFCKEKLIELDISDVFDILFSNNIIVLRESNFAFRVSYWIYYFAAKRMYFSKEFCDYILLDEHYVSFPEIIEFYTGIDRNREDVLEILKKDLKATTETVSNKTGLPKVMNPFDSIEWKPTNEELDRMQTEISKNVLNSKLPDSVKDQYADIHYNQLKPYDQSIHTIFHEYSFSILWQKIKACSRALRNSDYVEPDIKRSTLTEITAGLEQITNVILALTPVLATKGTATFEGRRFILSNGFSDSLVERIQEIILALPQNIVRYFKDDIYSNKIGPLLYDHMRSVENNLLKHKLVLLIISEKPPGWKKCVEEYIESISKNSYYLYDTVGYLSYDYAYSFSTEKELNEISYLLKMGFAKHEFGDKKPSLLKIKKISNKVIPKREID